MNFRSRDSLVSPLSFALSVTENRRDVIVDSYLAILFDKTFNFLFLVLKKCFMTFDRSNFKAPPFWCILSPPLRSPFYEIETEYNLTKLEGSDYPDLEQL